MRNSHEKIVTVEQMLRKRKQIKTMTQTFVFTNGCFDILHAGHISFLTFAKAQGDVLAVGINSDTSVRLIKGAPRPINGEQDRMLLVAALEMVDYVLLFPEREPAVVIEKLTPDVLVKGEDWSHYISGKDVVEQNGGRVVLAKMVSGKSTSKMIETIIEQHGYYSNAQ